MNAKMCHGGVFERALVPECSHTHTCAARGLHALAPSRVCPVQQSRRERFASIARGFTSSAHGVQQAIARIKNIFCAMYRGNSMSIMVPTIVLRLYARAKHQIWCLFPFP